MSPSVEMIVLHTLGKLTARRWSVSGWCTDCALRYHRRLPPGQTVPSGFSLDLQQLIAERGAGAKIVGMESPHTGSRHVLCQILGHLEDRLNAQCRYGSYRKANLWRRFRHGGGL